jgi:hypothetical protein
MTARKADLSLPSRTPAYVSREVGAAELHVSPETWDNWVTRGVLPPPAPGFPDSTPRWRWADVDAWLSKHGSEKQESTTFAPKLEDGTVADPFVANAGKLRHAQTKGRRRAAAA